MDRNIAGTLGAVRRQLFLRTKGPAVAGGILALAAVILAAVIFFSYPSAPEESALPIIQADARPYKVVPDEPGGMDIPHRDSTIFSSLRSSRDGADDNVENLLADEDEVEQPIPRSQLFAGLNTEENAEEGEQGLESIEPAASSEELLSRSDGAAEGATLSVQEKIAVLKEQDEKIINEIRESAQTVKADVIPEKVELETAAKPLEVPEIDAPAAVEEEKVEEKIAAVTPAPKAEPKPTAVKPSTAPASGNYYAQIGAVKSAAAAAAGWGTFQKQYSPALTGLDHRVERADLGHKGVFYRIQAGPVSKDKAASICSAIKAQSGGCLVVAK